MKTVKNYLAIVLVVLLATLSLGTIAGCAMDLQGKESQMAQQQIVGSTDGEVNEYVRVSPADLLKNYQNLLGQEVIFESEVFVKGESYIIIESGSIKVKAHDAEFVHYLAVTDTVQVHGFVTGMDAEGRLILDDSHINVWFSCYPREHSQEGRQVETNTNGIDGFGW